MSGCNESNIIFQQHLCKLGQLRRSNGKNSQVRPTGHTIWPPHFCTFCELVEGEENKLTTFSTFFALGPDLRRPPVRLFKLIPGHYKKYSHFKGRDTAPTYYQQQGGELYRRFVNFGNTALHCSVAQIPGRQGSGVRRTRAVLSRDRTEDDENFCTALPIHLRVQSMVVGSIYIHTSDCSKPEGSPPYMTAQDWLVALSILRLTLNSFSREKTTTQSPLATFLKSPSRLWVRGTSGERRSYLHTCTAGDEIETVSHCSLLLWISVTGHSIISGRNC